MRSNKTNSRRNSNLRNALIVGMAVVIGGACTVAALAGLRIVDPAKLAFWRSKPVAPPIPTGWIEVRTCAKTIPAHTLITNEYLENPRTGNFMGVFVPPEKVKVPAEKADQAFIAEVNKVRGRVAAHDIPAGSVFRERDFLPPGTKPGIVAGIPSGKRAMTLDASKIRGIHDVRAGDRIDLLASIPIDMPGSGYSNAGRLGTNVLMSPDSALVPKGSVVRPLVQDGVVVVAVRIRTMPTTSSSLMNGATTHNTPVQEVVVAIDPEEVAPLAASIDLKYEITCVARSGLPNPPAITPLAPTSPVASGSHGPEVTQAAFKSTSRALSGQALPLPALAPVQALHTPPIHAAHPIATKPDITPGLNPVADVRFMEVMVGKQRQFVLFNGPGSSPVIAGQSGEAGKAADAKPEEKSELETTN